MAAIKAKPGAEVSEPRRRSGEPRLASTASWLVLLASFGLSASTWVALAVLAGFTSAQTVFGVTLRLAWLMPIAVDGYVVVALVLWMAPVPAAVAEFAKKNTYGAAGIGIAAQMAYHGLLTYSTTLSVWRTILATIVGALPPAVAGLAVHMRALIRRHSSIDAADRQTSDRDINPVQVTPAPVPSPVPASIPVPAIPAAVVAPQPAATPAPSFRLSTPDEAPAGPVVADDSAPAVPVPPTPADLKARIAKPATAPTASAAAPARPARTALPEPAAQAATAPQLAPPAKDVSVERPGAAQLSLPLVSPQLVAQVREVARQYQAEHGTPITAGQLAVRLRVTSEIAAQALAALDDTAAPTARPVNGRRIPASR
jgi:hypothetical protein